MLAANGGAAELEDFRAEVLEGCEIELLLRIVAKVFAGGESGLESIGANDAAEGVIFGFVFDEEVVAEEVEEIGVESGLVAGVESLAHFEVEDAET
jgi:hypothetical protein